MVYRKLHEACLKEVGLTQVMAAMSMIRPLDVNQGPSPLHGHNPLRSFLFVLMKLALSIGPPTNS